MTLRRCFQWAHWPSRWWIAASAGGPGAEQRWWAEKRCQGSARRPCRQSALLKQRCGQGRWAREKHVSTSAVVNDRSSRSVPGETRRHTMRRIAKHARKATPAFGGPRTCRGNEEEPVLKMFCACFMQRQQLRPRDLLISDRSESLSWERVERGGVLGFRVLTTQRQQRCSVGVVLHRDDHDDMMFLTVNSCSSRSEGTLCMLLCWSTQW